MTHDLLMGTQISLYVRTIDCQKHTNILLKAQAENLTKLTIFTLDDFCKGYFNLSISSSALDGRKRRMWKFLILCITVCKTKSSNLIQNFGVLKAKCWFGMQIHTSSAADKPLCGAASVCCLHEDPLATMYSPTQTMSSQMAINTACNQPKQELITYKTARLASIPTPSRAIHGAVTLM